MKWGLRNYKTKQTNDTYLGTEPTATCTAQASDLLPFFFVRSQGTKSFSLSLFHTSAIFKCVRGKNLNLDQLL